MYQQLLESEINFSKIEKCIE